MLILDEKQECTMKGMLLNAGLFLIVLMSALASPPTHGYVKQALAYAKRIPVSQLDPKLPNRPFALWLKGVTGSNAKIRWEVNDCGEQTGGPADIGRDFPSCVEVDAEMRGNREVIMRIAVGTFHRGLTGNPTLYFALVEDNNGSRRLNELSELPGALATTSK